MEYHTSYSWFLLTILLFIAFAGWAVHEVLSVGKRSLPEEDKEVSTSL